MPPPQQKPRRGTKLAEQLAQELVQEIARTGLQPGDRLQSELLMAEERGVSRASLREALRILEVHGLITIRPGPGGGPELTALTTADFARMSALHFHAAGVTFRELLDVRLMLEPRMAELAADRRTPDQMLALRANVREHRKATDPSAMVTHAHEFHAIVSDMAGEDNRALSLMTSAAHAIFGVYLQQGRTLDAMRPTADVHGAISDAIEEFDARRAAKLMHEHMEASAETFAREHPTLIDRVVDWQS